MIVGDLSDQYAMDEAIKGCDVVYNFAAIADLDEALIAKIVEQSDQQAAGRSVGELEAERDANLVALLRALRAQDQGAGAFLNRLSQGGG